MALLYVAIKVILKFPFIIYICVFFASLLLEISIQLFFFPFLFYRYYFSVDIYVISAFFGFCKLSIFSLLYVDFKSYWYIHTNVNAGVSSCSFSQRI